jgi:hypothetical protein
MGDGSCVIVKKKFFIFKRYLCYWSRFESGDSPVFLEGDYKTFDFRTKLLNCAHRFKSEDLAKQALMDAKKVYELKKLTKTVVKIL